MIRSTSGTLVLGQDPGVATRGKTKAADETLGSVERQHIEETLRLCGGRINGAGNAAERLGVHPNTLRFRMKRLGITRSRNS
jgi:DNA-binding NtrC family response regulator